MSPSPRSPKQPPGEPARPRDTRTPSLDRRSPLVLDTHELARRPGAQREYVLDVPAPAGVGLDMIGIPEGSTIAFDLRLESVMEGVLVTGAAAADLVGECVRCLRDLEDTVDVDLTDLYLYDPDRDAAEDAETLALDGDLLDLEPPLRDAVVLALPVNPLCTPDCPGLCPECGVRLADEPGHAHDAPVDPRWAVLQGLDAAPEQADPAPPGPAGTEQDRAG